MPAPNITPDQFSAEVLESPAPVLVDFWGSHCGVCKAMSPIIDDLADETADKLKVVKFWLEIDSELVYVYRLVSIPTFILFQSGKEVKRLRGYATPADLRAYFEIA